MKTSSILSFTALIASALALPSYPRQTDVIPWSVTGYTEGCSPAGCVYNLDISFPGAPYSNGGEPAFSTHCTGTNIANKMQACEDPQVLIDSVPGFVNFTLQVEHTYSTANGARYHVLGNHTVVVDFHEPYSFDVYASSAYAVL